MEQGRKCQFGRPRWLRLMAWLSGGSFLWSVVLATPAAALTHQPPKMRVGIRTLTTEEMSKIVGAGYTVPQAGNGSVGISNLSGSFSGWEIRDSGNNVVANSGTPNGWTYSQTNGSTATIGAPGSANLGSYTVKATSNFISHMEGSFDVVQPATNLRSGDPFPWEEVGGVANPTGVHSGSPMRTVNMVNGNYQTVHPIVSWTCRGGMPLSFSLVHNSQSSNNLTLGPKWTHSFDLYGVTDANGNFTIHWGNDLSYVFTKNVNGTFSAPTGIYDSLVKNANATYTLTTKYQTVYQFNTSLRCTSITDENGNAITLGYSGNNVTTITDPTSRVLTLNYTSGKITSIVDPLSRTWTLAYDGSGRLQTVSNPVLNGNTYSTTYGYNTANDITSITKPRGFAWTFSYFADDSLQWVSYAAKI